MHTIWKYDKTQYAVGTCHARGTELDWQFIATIRGERCRQFAISLANFLNGGSDLMWTEADANNEIEWQ